MVPVRSGSHTGLIINQLNYLDLNKETIMHLDSSFLQQEQQCGLVSAH